MLHRPGHTISTKLAVLMLSALLSACGGDAVWIVARETVVQQFSPPPELDITRQEVSEFPYATLKAQAGKAQPALLILQVQEARGDQWMTGDNTSLLLRNGRLVGTVGLDDDLRDWSVEGNDPLAGNPHELSGTVTYEAVMEWRGDTLRFMVLQCELSPRGQERITILEIDFDVVRLREKCDGDGWDFRNDFWVDVYDGFVWQSRQHISENLSPLTLSILKPPAQ